MPHCLNPEVGCTVAPFGGSAGCGCSCRICVPPTLRDFHDLVPKLFEDRMRQLLVGRPAGIVCRHEDGEDSGTWVYVTVFVPDRELKR